LAGAGTLALAATASAAPTFSVSPDTGLTSGQVVVVSGSGFADGASGAIVECNNDPAQPTIAVLGNQVPVSCTNPLKNLDGTSPTGVLTSANFKVAEGTVGPPTTGTDSGSGSAATDAAAYPCPPTPSQVTAGYACTISFGDTDNDQVSQVLSFASGTGNTGNTGNTGTTTTSSTTTTTTTTPSSTTTSTTAPPNAPADSPTYSLACTAATVPVNLPSVVTEGVFETNPVAAGAVDNLKANSKAVPNSLLSGVNLLNGPDTGLGVVIEFPTSLEALTTPGATVTFSGTLPLVVTGGIGTPSLNLTGSFTVPGTYPSNAAVVVTGTQAGGTITAGQQTSMTVTQPQFTSASPLDLAVAIGSTSVPIICTSSSSETLDTATITGGNGTATPANPPSAGTSTGSAGGSSSGTSAKTAATDPSSLAFTGPGKGIWALAIGGFVLIDLGFLVVTIYYRPRELFAMAGRRINRIFGSDT
jgi:hypothetical protein